MADLNAKMSRAKLIDIGANLTDAMYRGIYRSNKKHPDDFKHMMSRAKNQGVEAMIITGGSLTDSKEALELANQESNLYSTVGCHPTRCNEFVVHPDGPSSYLEDLRNLIKSDKDKVVAVGELGLDYDRTQFCPIETQKIYFREQLSLAESTGLPLFLHCRAAWTDFFDIMQQNKSKWSDSGGVLHSFDGNEQDLAKALEMGLYIGINGCSMKKEENLTVIKQIPTDRLLIETDCPWCEIKKSHASHKYIKTIFKRSKDASDPEFPVKDRNEPAMLIQILEVLSSIRGENPSELAEQILRNTTQLFKTIDIDK